MLFNVETKKIITKKFWIAFKSTSQNFPSSNILSEYMLYAHIKNDIVA